MNRRGQGQIVAYVLLISFTIVLGIMVGSWMMKQAGKTGESAASKAEADIRCADVSISALCDGGPRVKNTGSFTISKLKVNGLDEPGIELKQVSSQSLNINDTVIPFIKIDGKDVGCTNRVQTIPDDICAEDE